MRRALAAAAAMAVALAGCGSSLAPVRRSSPVIARHSRFVAGFYATASSPTVGETLMASTGTWSNGPTSYSYQWQDCSGSCTDISGATSSSYTLQCSDVGDTIDVIVTASNVYGSASQTSAQTGTTSYTTPACPPSVVPNYYVAQSAAGTGNGSSCANAEAVSTLSTATEWTPGNVIGLCGTITSSITAQGSGTSGSPITVYWEPGATISEPYCPGSPGAGPGCFSTNGQSYLTLDGGSGGSILSTANGTGLANTQAAPHGIWANNCSGCVIENLNLSDMYQERAGSNDCTASNATGISVDDTTAGGGDGLTIRDNTFTQDQVGMDMKLSTADQNITISGNTINNTGTGANWIMPTTGGTAGPLLFYSNTVENLNAWDTSSDCYHEDGIHCWDSTSGGAHYSGGIYVYDNRFSGIGVNGTAYVYMEGTTGPQCADNTSPIYEFNNVMTASIAVTNGRNLNQVASGEPRDYNNTIVGSGTSGGTDATINDVATGAISENDVISTAATLRYANAPGVYATGQPDYNVYANGGTNAWVCATNYIAFASFASYQSCIGAESHSTTTASAALNSDGSPQAGSPVLGAGTNLTSLCTGDLAPLCSEINGTARPSSGAWDAGAY